MFASCGPNVNVEHGALIGSGNDIHIGANSSIGAHAWIAGPLIIGDNVMMGQNCTSIATSHGFDRVDIPMIEQPGKPLRPPIIEDDVWIGSNVILLPGCRIGRGSIVAAGAVVTKDVVPFSIVGGNPARLIRNRLSGKGDEEFPLASAPSGSEGSD